MGAVMRRAMRDIDILLKVALLVGRFLSLLCYMPISRRRCGCQLNATAANFNPSFRFDGGRRASYASRPAFIRANAGDIFGTMFHRHADDLAIISPLQQNLVTAPRYLDTDTRFINIASPMHEQPRCRRRADIFGGGAA